MKEICVLLIDDTRGEREALARYLRSAAGFQIQPYAAGEEALEHLETGWQDYTTVLLDYVLQADKMPGDEVLQTIKDRYPYLPVIVFTGLDPARGVQALSEGAYRYLRKPLDHTELVTIINSLAEQEAIFRRMAQDVRQMLGSDMCLVWRLDGRTRRFQIVAWDGDRDLAAEYRRTIFLDLDAEATRRLFEKEKPIFLSNVQDQESAPHYRPRDYAVDQGWTSLISIPLVRQEQIIGLVDSYTYQELDKTQAADSLENILTPFAHQAAEAAWNAELSNRLQVLQGLNEVLAGTFEEETILQQILAKGIELVAAQAGWVYKLDVHRKKLLLRDSFGIEEERVGVERDLGAGISGYVAQTGQALNVPDVTRLSEEYQHLEIPGLEVCSEVAVPLRRGEQTVGVLTVTSPLPNAFSAEDVSLLSSLAAQAAVAIGRADVTRHSKKLGQMALTGDFDGLAKYVVEAARDLTGADVILWMLSEAEDEWGQWLRVKAHRGDFREDYPDKARTPITLDPLVLAVDHPSITSLALARGEPIVRRDIWDESEAPEEPRFHNREAAEQHGWHGFMAVPLLTRGGQPLGSLSLYGREVAKFGEAEVSLMQVFADRVCAALQNAAQYDMLRKLNEIGQKLSAMPLSPKDVLTQIARSALEILEADTVDLYQYWAGQGRFEMPPIMMGKRLSPKFIPKQIAPDDVVVRIVESQTPIFASDARAEPVLIGKWETNRKGRPKQRFVIREKIFSSAGVPLVAEEKVVGVLFVGYRRKQDFDTDTELKERINLFAHQAAIAIGNTRLLEAIQNRNQVMAQLLDVGPAIGKLTLPRAKTALSRIALSLCDQVSADSVVIYPYDSQRPGFWDEDNVASYGLWHPLILVDKPREKGLSVRIQNEKWLEVSDVSHPDTPMDHHLLEREGIQAFVGVALQQQDQDRGVLYVNFRKPHSFSPQEIDVIRAYAHQAAQEISQGAEVEGLTLPDLLNDILSKAQNSLGADLVILHRYQQGRDEEFVGRPLVAGKLNDRDRMMHKPLLTTAPRQLIERGEAYYAKDVNTHEFYTALPGGKSLFVEREDVRSACGVPLKAENEHVGALFVNYREPHEFDDDMKRTIQLFADQTAIAIRNARLLTQTQALQEIAEQLSEFSLKPQLIFGLILERALDLIGFSKGWISLWDRASGILEMKAARGLGQEAWRELSSNKGIIGRVVREGQAMRVDDIATIGYYEGFFSDTVSELCVPITYQGQVLGALNVESTQQAAFSQRDEELLTTLANQAASAIHNAEILEERQRESRSLRALHEIGRRINVEHEVRPILDFLVPQVIELLRMSSGIIFLVDKATMQIIDRFGYPADFHHPKPRISEDTSLTRTVLTSGNPIVIKDASKDDRINRVLIKQNVRSMVAWPIQRGGEPIGVLFLNGNHVRKFSDWERDLLDALSEQVAIAIENARLHQQRVKDLSAFLEVNRAISSQEWNRIARLIAQQATELSSADYGTLWLLSRDKRCLELGATYGREPKQDRISLDERSISSYVARAAKPYNCPDVSKDDKYLLWYPDIQSNLVVPAVSRGKVIGILHVSSVKQAAFSDYQQQLLQSLADQAAIAIETARLFQQLTDANKQLSLSVERQSAVSEVGRQLTASIRLSETEIVNSLHEQASRVMDTDNMYVALYDASVDLIRFALAYVGGEKVDTATAEGWQPRRRGEKGVGRTEWIIQNGHHLLDKTLAESTDWYEQAGRKDYIGQPFASWIGMPMMIGDRVLGVVATYHATEEYVYDEDDVQVLRMMASYAAIALDNARLVQDLERRIAELDKLRELSEELSAGVWLGEM